MFDINFLLRSSRSFIRESSRRFLPVEEGGVTKVQPLPTTTNSPPQVAPFHNKSVNCPVKAALSLDDPRRPAETRTERSTTRGQQGPEERPRPPAYPNTGWGRRHTTF